MQKLFQFQNISAQGQNEADKEYFKDKGGQTDT